MNKKNLLGVICRYRENIMDYTIVINDAMMRSIAIIIRNMMEQRFYIMVSIVVLPVICIMNGTVSK